MHLMKAVAGGNLGYFHRGDLGRALELTAQFRRLPQNIYQDIGVQAECGCLHLCYDPRETFAKTCHHRQTDQAFSTHQTDFDASSVLHHTENGS